MNYRYRLSRAIAGLTFVAASVAILSACGGSRISQSLNPELEHKLLAGLPDLASLKELSAISELQQNGSEVLDSSSGAVIDDTVNFETLLDAGDGGHFEWALYSFDPGTDPLVELQVELAGREAADQPFVAIANFQRESWDISGPLDSDTLVLPLDPATALSGDGKVFAAVIAPLGSNFSVTRLILRHLLNDAPLADLQAENPQGDAPLLVNLDASGSADADGSIVKYEWDALGDGIFEADTGSTPTFSTNYASPTVVNAAVRITDDDGATAVASLQIRVTQNGNAPPIAVLESDISEGDGEAGFDVNFSSDSSTDLDGSIALYEWDLDGDTTTGTGGFEVSSTTPDLQTPNYTTAGEIKVRLRVTDNGGLSNVDTLTIVSHGWVVVPVDAGGGTQVALAKVGKFPTIAFRGPGAGNDLLLYRHSATEFGTHATDWVSADTGISGIGGALDLIAVNNRALIVYRSASGTSCARHVSGSVDLPANWASIDVDSGFTALKIAASLVGGNPAFCSSKSGGGAQPLRFFRSSTASGAAAADWQGLTLDEAVLSSAPIKPVDVGGNPAVMFIHELNGSDLELVYARSDTATGASISDWQTVILSPGALTNSDICSMALVNGSPAFALTRNAGTELSFGFSNSSLGLDILDWAKIDLVDNLSGPGRVLLDTVAGTPLIADQVGDLSLRSSSTADGRLISDWGPEEQVSADSGSDFDMADIGGYPALVYRDGQFSSSAVTYAIRF